MLINSIIPDQSESRQPFSPPPRHGVVIEPRPSVTYWITPIKVVGSVRPADGIWIRAPRFWGDVTAARAELYPYYFRPIPGLPEHPRKPWDGHPYRYKGEEKGYTRETWNAGLYRSQGINPDLIQAGDRIGLRVVEYIDIATKQINLHCDCGEKRDYPLFCFMRSLPLVCSPQCFRDDSIIEITRAL